MTDEMYDDGLIHGHAWASGGSERDEHPVVADASSVPTVSSVFHDDHVHGF